jgi:hypothetical protein
MIERIPQRNQADCAICVVAMVMAHPYSYERVSSDSMKYAKICDDGNITHGGSRTFVTKVSGPFIAPSWICMLYRNLMGGLLGWWEWTFHI